MHWQAYYIRHLGVRCPVCHSDNITGGHVSVDAATASQSVTCDNCDSSWDDHYKLVEVTNLCVGIPQWGPGDVVVWTDPLQPHVPQLGKVLEANDSALPNPIVHVRLNDGRKISGRPTEFKLWEEHV